MRSTSTRFGIATARGEGRLPVRFGVRDRARLPVLGRWPLTRLLSAPVSRGLSVSESKVTTSSLDSTRAPAICSKASESWSTHIRSAGTACSATMVS
eukprot:872269-Rhodomonas_salina.1